MFTRDNQDMDRRLGTDIPKSDDGLIAVNNIPFNSALNNATEKTITHS
jgi:hypothetical protein